jgi:hypothetical protein
MKRKTKLQKWIPSAVFALILAGSTSTALAQLDIATFDTDVSEIGGTGGSVPPSSVTWASTGNPGGSAYIAIPWANNTGWQDDQISFNNSSGNAANYLLLECDVKVDIANSTLTDSGDYGGFGVYLNGWNGDQGWTWLGGGTIQNVAGWQHFSGSVAVYQGHFDQVVVGFNVNQYGTGVHAGPCKYWIDNVIFTPAPLNVPAPTLQNPMPAPKHTGLTLLPATTSQYQRVMVYPATTLGTGFGWYNSANFPVSYSFTIADFPNLPNYGAQVFWVPNNAMMWGVGDTSIDWNMTNGLVLSISANYNNPPTGWGVTFSAKTNLPGANPNLTITNFAYGSLPVGTWTVTFHNNTDFTITTPDPSVVVNGSLDAATANLVSGNAAGSTAMVPYFGIQNNNLICIGHPAVFNNITMNNVITNGVLGTLSDNFNNGSLDTTKWTKLTDQGNDITVNSGLQWYVAWNMPNDVGYGPLQAAASPIGPWVDFSPASSWIVVNGTNRTATITTADMDSKLGGTSTGYFRLVKRTFTQLQVLLPGEQNAPNTPTGKTGTPDEVYLSQGGNEDVTVNAVDDNYNIVNSSDTIQLTCSTDPLSFMPNNAAMSGGTATFTDLNAVAFGTTGLQTITAADVTPGSTIPTANSSQVLVGN